MIRNIAIILLLCLAIGLHNVAGADRLDDKIRAASSDIKVFCPATDTKYIQWSALLYLNQIYGAEIFVALFQPSPVFGCKIKSTIDGQFHLARIGRGTGAEYNTLVDSTLARLFDSQYPDVAIFEAGSAEDSLFLASLLEGAEYISRNDSAAISSLSKIYLRGWKEEGAAVIFNDEELYQKYLIKAEDISKVFGVDGPLNYRPVRFRRYFLLNQEPSSKYTVNDFLYGTGHESFRLPGLVEDRLPEGPEKKNVLRRLDSYLSSVRTAVHPWLSRAEKLKLLLTAYSDISRLVDMIQSGSGNLAEANIGDLVRTTKHKTFLAIEEAVGIEWQGGLEMRDTPFGRSGKLSLDLQLTGPRNIELSYFKVHPAPDETITVDSISQIIHPHQRFFREYPIDLNLLDFSEFSGDSLLFSIEVIVEGLTLDLHVPFSDYADEGVSIRFLPGYTFLTPFTEDQYTSLAQPFDWQLLVTKPFGSELDGRVKISNPDGIVVGTFDDHIFMPQGITSRYFDIHFAAGRSIEYDLKTVRASLEVGGQIVAETGANVRVIRCMIPETRDIGFAPDPEGRLEDFLRIARVSFQPFTPRSLIRAPLEAYDLLIIGADAVEFYDVLRTVNDRLYEFVRNGGEVLIMGQSFGWPHDVFDIPIYTSKMVKSERGRTVQQSHRLVKQPYTINTFTLLVDIHETTPAYPAIIGGGTEIISAGELGSYLTVFTIGEGHVIYCGLPLLEMAAKLDVDAIHLMANLLNFGHEN